MSRTSLSELEKIAICEIRAKYSQSGLYRNDGSAEPLWTYDGRWGSGTPIIAPDGEHVIFEGDWTDDEYGFRAVEFTFKGKTIRAYSDLEIIPHWLLKATLNGLSPPSCWQTSFNPEQMTYTIRTNQGEDIVFDVKSGEIIEIRSPFPIVYGVAFLATATLITIGIVRWRRNGERHAD